MVPLQEGPDVVDGTGGAIIGITAIGIGALVGYGAYKNVPVFGPAGLLTSAITTGKLPAASAAGSSSTAAGSSSTAKSSSPVGAGIIAGAQQVGITIPSTQTLTSWQKISEVITAVSGGLLP
jgi:hypothetical protein